MRVTELILFAPAPLATVAVITGGARRGFLWVYLPTLLLLPMYFTYRLPHLPPVTFLDMAMIPVALALLAEGLPGWRLRAMDLAVLAFVLSAGYSEARGGTTHDGGLQVYANLIAVAFPYMIGRQLMEPRKGATHAQAVEWRAQFVRLFLGLLTLDAFLGVYDFLSGKSSSQRFWKLFFPDQTVDWPEQLRWGFGRIQGPFAQAILTGMIFTIGIAYCMWLQRADGRWGSRPLAAEIRVRWRHVVLVAMVAGLLMSQSRGPWIGGVILLAVMWLPHASSFRQALALILVLGTVGGLGAYVYGKKYTAGDREHARNMEQENAIYRRELIGNYMPLVLEKPLTGWGVSFYPSVQGQKSIDNEYLFLAVIQGVPGVLLFVLMSVGGCVRVARLIRYAEHADDRFLLYAQLAIIVSLLITITTVYLGQQVEPLFFLVLGWMQAMDRDRLRTDSAWSRQQVQRRQWMASVLG